MQPSTSTTTRSRSLSSSIHVCSLSILPAMLTRTGARHLVSVISLDDMVATPDGFSPDGHLRLAVHDITEPQDGLVHPAPEHIEDLVRFARAWDHAGPLVVHCFAGISRSTAAAYITLCTVNPEGAEAKIATRLRAASAIAHPNSLMIRLADDVLG